MQNGVLGLSKLVDNELVGDLYALRFTYVYPYHTNREM